MSEKELAHGRPVDLAIEVTNSSSQAMNLEFLLDEREFWDDRAIVKYVNQNGNALEYGKSAIIKDKEEFVILAEVKYNKNAIDMLTQMDEQLRHFERDRKLRVALCFLVTNGSEEDYTHQKAFLKDLFDKKFVGQDRLSHVYQHYEKGSLFHVYLPYIPLYRLFAKIDQNLTDMRSDMNDIKLDMKHIKADVANIKVCVEAIEQMIRELLVEEE